MKALPRLASTLALTSVAAFAMTARAETEGESQCATARASARLAETSGALRDARIAAQICAADPCSDEAQAECAAILDRIDHMIASVTVAIVDAHGRPIAGSRVTIGEHTFAPEETIVLEPGDYKLLIETPDGTQVTRLVSLAHGEAKRESVIVTNGAELTPATAPPGPSALDTVGTTSLPPSPSGAAATPRRIISTAELALYRRLGVASTAIGFLSLGIGAYFALQAHAKSDEAGCSNGQCASQANLSIHEDATTATNEAIGFLIAGAVFGGGGGLLWYSAPKLATVQPPVIDARARLFRVAPSLGTRAGGMSGVTVLGSF